MLNETVLGTLLIAALSSAMVNEAVLGTLLISALSNAMFPTFNHNSVVDV